MRSIRSSRPWACSKAEFGCRDFYAHAGEVPGIDPDSLDCVSVPNKLRVECEQNSPDFSFRHFDGDGAGIAHGNLLRVQGVLDQQSVITDHLCNFRHFVIKNDCHQALGITATATAAMTLTNALTVNATGASHGATRRGRRTSQRSRGAWPSWKSNWRVGQWPAL
jgi:hypothetical protein